jgi:hypothetical protein
MQKPLIVVPLPPAGGMVQLLLNRRAQQQFL